MRLSHLPTQAAWRHDGARAGFEVLFPDDIDSGHVLRGCTTGWEGGSAWSVGYLIEVDAGWRTMRAEATGRVRTGDLRRVAERIDGDRWLVDGVLRPDLDGCVDVDFETSAATNTLPLHRLDLPVGEWTDAPAAFVRAEDLRVERLEQSYCHTAEGSGTLTVDYRSPTFDFAATLEYDESGLIVAYPGIASRFTAERRTSS